MISLRSALCILVLIVCVGVTPPSTRAGAPFRTDDPEIVEFGQWEFSLAQMYSNDKDGVSGTIPQFEVDYGVAPDVQIHVLLPMAYEKPRRSPTLYGPGDCELGVKYRFIQESDTRPMVAIFPLLHAPTGNSGRGLGSGHTHLFLPVWLQKSWGAWQSYGGGGYWINPGPGNKNYWFAGWQVQREINEWLTLGAELFYNTPINTGGDHELGYNVGGEISLAPNHHLLFSAGAGIRGQNLFSGYAGYRFTWGKSGNR